MVHKLQDHVGSGRHLLDLVPGKPDDRVHPPCFSRVSIKYPEFYTGFLWMQFNSGTYTPGECDLNCLIFSHVFSLAWCMTAHAGAPMFVSAALRTGPVPPWNTLFVAFEQFAHCNCHRSWECWYDRKSA